jgi:hypothetical protein
MTMSATQAGQNGRAPAAPFVLAIGAENNFVHVYKDEAALLRDGDIGAGVGESRFPLEFFDSDGQRLAGVYDGEWRLTRLVPTDDDPRPRRLAERVAGVLAYLRTYVEEHPDVMRLYGLTQEEALALFAGPSRGQDLRSLLAPLLVVDLEDDHFPVGALGDDDDRGIMHNIFHHGHP